MIGVERRVFTEAVLTAAASVGAIGDAEVPRGGVAGWQGQPNADGSNFTPYAVITPVQVPTGSGPVTDPQGDVQLPYAVTSYGVSREQVEWFADRTRAALHSLHRESLTMWSGTSNEYTRKIQAVTEQSIGAIQRVDQTDPPIYTQTDVVSFWTSR